MRSRWLQLVLSGLIILVALEARFLNPDFLQNLLTLVFVQSGHSTPSPSLQGFQIFTRGSSTTTVAVQAVPFGYKTHF